MKIFYSVLLLMGEVDHYSRCLYRVLIGTIQGYHLFVPEINNFLIDQLGTVVTVGVLYAIPLCLLWRSRIIFEIVRFRFMRGSSG